VLLAKNPSTYTGSGTKTYIGSYAKSNPALFIKLQEGEELRTRRKGDDLLGTFK
jgi:hypothetical protein